MKLFISPNDVLFFRDGRPFDAGSDNTARMIFPPSPTTFYGAIRTAIMSQKNVSFNKLKNSGILSEELNEVAIENDNRTLTISDFGLARKISSSIERIFPVPSDIVKEKERENFYTVTPKTLDNLVSNFPNESLLPLGFTDESDKIFEACNEYFINENGLSAYLLKQPLDKDHFIRKEKVFTADSRIGIKRNNNTFSSEEGFIYSLEFAHLCKEYGLSNKEFGFVIEINSQLLNTTDAELKALRLGGESRSAFYEEEVENWKEVAKPDIKNKFKLILLTPAVFENGWIPDGLCDINVDGKKVLQGEINGAKVKLISAVVDRYIGIGGWDILNRKSKPLKRSVQAGTVYFFESIDGKNFNQDDVYNKLFMKSIIKDKNLQKEGLGLTIIGVW
jgi:CRISPR-associated protein Cmr3